MDYNNFAASDLGQMLVEMFAYMSSVIALRADMTANEMYIDTVKNEDNLKRLLQLIGVNMKGPTSSKATGLLTLPADVTFDTQVVINKADRSVGVINQRSNVPLTYTITKQQTDGTLDLFTEDLSLESSDFNGQVASGLFLVEGEFNSANGTFRGGVRTEPKLCLKKHILEGSVVCLLSETG